MGDFLIFKLFEMLVLYFYTDVFFWGGIFNDLEVSYKLYSVKSMEEKFHFLLLHAADHVWSLFDKFVFLRR